MREIDKDGEPVAILNEKIDWEMFRFDLENARKKVRKSNAGRKAFDSVMMFKILLLQSLSNLSDDATEAQIKGWLSAFSRLGALF